MDGGSAKQDSRPSIPIVEALRGSLRGVPSWVRWLLAILPIRIALMTFAPVLPEEAYHWNFARHLDWSYYDHPPVIAWSIAAGRLLFGDNQVGIRAVTLLYSVGTTILLARMAKRFYGEAAAVWTVILFTLMPVAMLSSEAGFPDSPLLFFWTLAMSLTWRAIDGEDGRRWLPTGAALGAAMLSKYTAVLLVPGVLLYLLCSKRDRRWLATPWPYLAGFMALGVFGPAIYWNWKHEWVSFLYQSQGRMDEARGTPGRPGRFLLNQLLGIFPLTFPVMLATVARLTRTSRPEEHFLRACALPFFLIFLIVSFARPVHLLWPLPAYMSVVLVMAAFLSEAVGAIARFYGRARTALIALSAAGLVAGGIHLWLFIPGINPMHGPYGWKEVAERARQVKSTLPESAFYLALGRKYTVASQLAYQLNLPNDVHGDNLIGESAQQYEFWSDAASLKGRDAVIVIEGVRRTNRYQRLLQQFDSVEPSGEVVVPVGRGSAASSLVFVLYRARGFRPLERK